VLLALVETGAVGRGGDTGSHAEGEGGLSAFEPPTPVRRQVSEIRRLNLSLPYVE
jgi:hypothetical protein